MDNSPLGAALQAFRQTVLANQAASSRAPAQRAVVQREPIIPSGMEPARHIDPDVGGDYDNYLTSLVLTPPEILSAFSQELSPLEQESTLIQFETLMRLLVLRHPAAQVTIIAFQQAQPGKDKLALLMQIAGLIDTHLYPVVLAQQELEASALLEQQDRDASALLEQQDRDASAETPKGSLEGPFLYVRFYNRPTKTRCEIRVSLLRHGLWLMEDSHPEEKNSVLLPWVLGALETDGAELGAQLACVADWHGAGKLYKTSSGRIFEVDGAKHFFPVQGPGVIFLSRGQYLTLRAIVALFHTNFGSKVRGALDHVHLFKILDGEAPAEVSTCLSQLQLSRAALPDSLVDKLLAEYVKPYACPSMTGMLMQLAELIRQTREYDQARAQRDRRKEQEAEDRERTRNQPGGQ